MHRSIYLPSHLKLLLKEKKLVPRRSRFFPLTLLHSEWPKLRSNLKFSVATFGTAKEIINFWKFAKIKICFAVSGEPKLHLELSNTTSITPNATCPR